MTRAIVLNNHTLGVIHTNGLQVLRTHPWRGSPHHCGESIIAFDKVLMAGKFRPATEQDFNDFNVMFHPDYLTEI